MLAASDRRDKDSAACRRGRYEPNTVRKKKEDWGTLYGPNCCYGIDDFFRPEPSAAVGVSAAALCRMDLLWGDEPRTGLARGRSITDTSAGRSAPERPREMRDEREMKVKKKPL
jgi:hypothetical protein